MPYLFDITEPLIKTLEHFAGLPKHQLAGHAANFEFWRSEVEHRIQAIDSYGKRFRRLKEAQARYVKAHGAGVVHEEGCFGDIYERKASAPPLQKNLRDPELKELKSRLQDALNRFVERLEKEQLLPERSAEPSDGANAASPRRSS